MVGLKFEGGAELAKALAALPEAVSRDIQTEALIKGAEIIRDRAAQLCRRRSPAPDLADNILVGPVKRTSSEVKGGVEATAGIGVGFGFFYDYFLEFGTKYAGAHPFYRPALDETAGAAIAAIGADLGAAIAKGSASGAAKGGRLA